MILDSKTSTLHSDYGSFNKPFGEIIIESDNTVVDGRRSEMAQSSDVYQRQPLLPGTSSKNKDKWGALGSTSNYFNHDKIDELSQEGLNSGVPNILNSGIVKLDIPAPLREESRFPKEKWKTFTAFLFMAVNFVFTTVSLAMVHDRVPDRNIYDPLPDIFLDNVTGQDWALNVSEVLIMIVSNSAVILIIFHKHRFIVLRRIFLLLGLLYMMRSITMFVTVLPVSSKTYYCSPKANSTTPILITKRVFQLLSGFGLSINGKHTYCGDYIYSGHTVIHVLSYLIFKEYSPKRCLLLHWLTGLTALVGVIMVLVAHGHYTVDVLIAYYVTTRLWYIYHTLANNINLKQHGPNNSLARLWWFPLFKYFEKNVGGPVPRQYDWPFPWRRRFLTKHPNRDS
ncbi:phosphatidylcholine:ceramide cholinephosphotransferase 1-like [Leptopilina heterotoma]|uniref:phosphatidylcholine:ceramide cholinephosphotransferase 1-like n=1 Tax=Leptopilina heterotoma TaxID=63436 RepID=UPI001CA9158C|nr:phosphatidylcholine:ceramide cholinephosphotransferase 1-like [Leptopilina heterotoma]XP_043483519.1 phosphatidylcholine:ceramide cholinephosphotransferase 1-like [Leptopilina heterotoma]XP_043483520.1 phosphatidylcholine:ceramide cholinephosphotransferase 1-like [Leptopilina heterotoma]XP_043483521.1 phosphatidylcholine:ceramide cholinephosphotransferase 1-like [Leptopilina heterotoma]XP_043483522.1 phosphatidylcholine:ceramide cholinephosphotransferase 1-like [Leptopilina heterotoma]